jgi:hypothetical protein
VACKAILTARNTFTALEQAAAAAAAAKERDGGSGSDQGCCTVCLDDDPKPIQAGCGCRGDAGLAHIECRVTAAEYAQKGAASSMSVRDQQQASMKWEKCQTCDVDYTGRMGLGLAMERWRRAQRLPETDRERVWAANFLASNLLFNAKGVKTESFARHTSELALRVFGPDDIIVIDTQNILACALQDARKLEESEKIQRHLHAESLRLLGPDAQRTLRFGEVVADYMMLQGQKEEALDMLRDILARFKRTNGLEHLTTLSCGAKLAEAFGHANRCDVRAWPRWCTWSAFLS